MPPVSEILEFKVTNFNRVAAIVGGFLSVFGLVSYLLKENFYLGEAGGFLCQTTRLHGTMQYYGALHNSSCMADHFH